MGGGPVERPGPGGLSPNGVRTGSRRFHPPGPRRRPALRRPVDRQREGRHARREGFDRGVRRGQGRPDRRGRHVAGPRPVDRPADRADRRGRRDAPSRSLRQPRPPPRRRHEREGPRDPVLSLARRYQELHRRAREGSAEGDVDRRPLRLPDPARREPVPDACRAGRDRARPPRAPPGRAGGDGQLEGAGGLRRDEADARSARGEGRPRPVDGRGDRDDPQRLLGPQRPARLHLGRRRRGRRRAGQEIVRALQRQGHHQRGRPRGEHLGLADLSRPPRPRRADGPRQRNAQSWRTRPARGRRSSNPSRRWRPTIRPSLTVRRAWATTGSGSGR